MRSQAYSTISGAIHSATKYDLGRATGGQAVGGPVKNAKATMWDMMTLYDTHKKKTEEQEAFIAHKQ